MLGGGGDKRRKLDLKSICSLTFLFKAICVCVWNIDRQTVAGGSERSDQLYSILLLCICP